MPNSFAEIPYGSSSAGIALNYGDTVPEGAVNLAYVQTMVPPVSDVVDIEDDLADADKYAGNTIGAAVRPLSIIRGQLIDPKTNNLWVAPTDNVLFTTVTASLTDAAGAITNIPLFYAEELRFPIPVSALPAILQDALSQGIPLGASSYLNPDLASLSNLVTITSDSGNLVPTGYLWQVLPTSIVGGNLFMTIYTNFASSFQQRFVMSWGPFSETLNVHPIYYQHKTTPDTNVYLAKAITDNSVGSIAQSGTIVSGSSTAQIVAGGGVGTSNQPRSSPVSNVSHTSIISSSSSTPATAAIAETTATPFYVSGPTGYTVFPASPVTYTTPATIAAPINPTTALTLQLTEASCQADANGSALIFVTLYDPTNIPVRSWPAVTAPTTFTYQDPNAIAGSYSWTITASVSDTLGIEHSVAQGTYTYTTVWQGSYGWAVPVATTFTNKPGAISNFQTPASTLAPAGSATKLSLNITGISTPTNPFGTTNYSVILTDPAGVAQFTWNNLTSTQVLIYPLTGTTQPSALAGSWTWSIVAQCANNQTGTATFTTSLTAIQTWFVSVPGTATLFSNQDGAMVSYTTAATTLAPTNVNTALHLNLTTVTTQLDSKGTSSVKVELVDPTGRIVETWANITNPQSFSYANLAAVQGQWVWKVWTTCTNTGLSISSYTDTWSGSYSWFQPDPAAAGSSIESRTIGFTFQVGTPDGTIYTTTDDGPQIYLQDPDNLSAADNWYLRLHRGWLSFTDSFAHTYLVGLEPYYSQNFDGIIPVITNQRQQALIVNQNAVRVPNTPILVDPNYPIDVIVTRRSSGFSFDTWVTRDNSLSSGNYAPAALADINSAKGTITLGNYLLQSNDTVHVTYSYLEYYYVYRGFTDGFGRFVHFDLNPSGGHTWFNLWNIDDHAGSAHASGTSIPTIASSVSNVATLVNHVDAFAQSAEVDHVFSASATSNAAMTLPFRTSSTATISSSATSATAGVVTQFTDQSISGITATAVQSSAPGPIGITNAFSAIATLAQVPHSTTATTPASATLINAGTPSVAQHTLTSLSRVTGSPFTFTLNAPVTDTSVRISGSPFIRHTLTLPAPVTTTVQVDSPPVDASSELTFTFQGLSALAPGAVAQYPLLATDPTATPVSGAPGPTVVLEAMLIAPSGTIVATQTFSSVAPVVFNLFAAGLTETGLYTIEVSLVAMNGPLTWFDTQVLAGTYVIGGTILASALLSATASTFATVPGAATSITTDVATIAPTTAASELKLLLSSITLPQDSSGTTSYNATLTAPSGVVVFSQSNVTTNTMLVYSNAAAVGGSYTWKIWPTVTSLNFGSSSYNCSVTAEAAWFETVVTNTFTYAPLPSIPVHYFTPVSTLAPAGSATQLSVAVGTYAAYQDSNGTGELEYTLTDPNGITVAAGTVANNTTLTYSASGAVAGQYTWAFDANVIPVAQPNLGGSYPVAATMVLGWFQTVTNTSFVYTAIDGISAQYQLSSSTSAPTASASALTLNLTTLTVPSDANGNSWIDIVLVNPTGSVVANFDSIVTIPLQPLTYFDPGAGAGTYTWKITAKSGSAGTGTASYVCSFSGTLHSNASSSSTAFTAFNPASTIVSTSASTIAPTNAATQLNLDVAELVLSNDIFGTSGLSVSLVLNATQTVLQTWTTTVAQIFTYSNASAVGGQYNWVIQPTVTPSGTGTGSYTSTLVGYYGWHEARTPSYLATAPATATANVTVTIQPVDASTQLTCSITSLTIPADDNGTSFYVVGLKNPSGTIVKQWEIFDLTTLAYFSLGPPLGTWTWFFFPAVTNSWTGAGTYVTAIAGNVGHYQSDPIPTTFYNPVPGAVSTYPTGTFTVAPASAASALSLEFTNVSLVSDNFGASSLQVTLNAPTGETLQTWSVSTPQRLTYFNAAAVDGIYVWTVQGEAASFGGGTARYVTQWSAELGWFEAVENDLETSALVARSLYLYLTVDGYPFHAVLDPLDNPDTPLAYDTNNAMNGTRYALMPTIHAF